MTLSATHLRWILNLWPSFWAAGIRVLQIKADYSYAKVRLAFRWYNKNYMRTQYGGSLYSMTDPFYVIMLLQRLGKGFAAWDKQAEIDYLKPGRGEVFAEFHLSQEQVEQIRQEAMQQQKTFIDFVIPIYDKQQETIAMVKRKIYVSYRPPKD